MREAVIQTILHVARSFPVIRFDAAMTLAKKHYQRLWFPEPGTGGAISSRAEFGLTREQFDQVFPEEFWRDVVDRVATEAPDTLLLAEAFWMMEGYFVRTLGMHRVYNSAFMNILRDEDNGKYRSVMKNTIEFDPEVLKRYVNFMNNPDEKTAVEQFGKGDKYFGICMMMSTLPGLPMFGHGQLEGFSEKYGMEYRRAYYDEIPDQWLVDRHAREISPLLHKRYVFAGVDNFLLYDVYAPEGHVEENVFAYSNSYGAEKALVVYHNKFADTRGWIRTSAAYAVKTGHGDEKVLVQRELKDGLSLRDAEDVYYIFRDAITGLEYLRNGRELCQQGFYIELGAYQYHVFMDWREAVDDEERRYAQLAESLKGGGVPSIDEAVREVFARPVLVPFKELANAGFYRWLLEQRVAEAAPELDTALLEEVLTKAQHVVDGIQYLLKIDPVDTIVPEATRSDFTAILQLPICAARFPLPKSRKYTAALQYLQANLQPEAETQALAWATLLSWASVRSLGQVVDDVDAPARSRAWLDEWLLGRTAAQTLMTLGIADWQAWQAVSLLKVLTTHQQWHAADAPAKKRVSQLLETLLADEDVRVFLKINRYNGIDWYNQEAFEQLLWGLYAVAVIDVTADEGVDPVVVADVLVAVHDVIKKLQDAQADSEYQVEKLKAAVTPAPATRARKAKADA